MKKILITVLLIITTGLFAELKLAYINTEKLMADNPEAVKAKTELVKWNKLKEADAIKMENEIKKLEEEMKNMSMLISEEKKKEKLAEGQKKMQDYYAYKEKVWGQGGDYYKENQKMMEPVIKKINDTIKMVSERDGYDFVLDANTGSLLFAKPIYDITEKVQKELTTK